MTESSEAYELSNVVETALAKALVLAAEAKRWDVVSQIADELGKRGTAQIAHAASATSRSDQSGASSSANRGRLAIEDRALRAARPGIEARSRCQTRN